MRPLALLLFCLGAAALVIAVPVSAAAEQVRPLDGAALQRQLDLVVGVSWSERKLRDALNRLSGNQGVAIFLDRRVDPDQTIDFSVGNVSLRECLEQLAASRKLGLSFVGPVAYFGPPATAEKLATLAALVDEGARQLPSPLPARLLRRQTWQWDALSSPRNLIEQLAEQTGIRIEGVDRVPHDLWPAVSLPPLTFGERLTLVTAGFDLTCRFDRDGGGAVLVPVPSDVKLRRTYDAASGGPALATKLAELFPQTSVRWADDTLIVEGRVEDHQAIARRLQGGSTGRPSPPVRGETRYTLKVQNQPVGALVRTLAAKLSLQARFDPATSQRLEKRVSFDVQEATMDQLLDAALAPAGLAYRLQGQQLLILPSDK